MLNHGTLYKWKQDSNKRWAINKNEEWEDGSTTEKKPLSNDKSAGMKRMLHTGSKFMQNTDWSTIEQVPAFE